MVNWHPRWNQVIIFFVILGQRYFSELSQNLLENKQQTMKEVERHAGTLLFFTVLRAKMQFSYFEHVRRAKIAFSYMHMSHYIFLRS